MSVLEGARDYCRRGWAPIPVPFRSKAPGLKGWERLRLDGERELSAYFNGGPQNVGVLLGAPSAWLVDVDLDCSEALRLAPAFLPPTRSRFGRASRRASHWLYVVTTPAETEKFSDPTVPEDEKGMLVELRSTGAQTVFPGSVHEGGEPIEWDEDGDQARGDGPTLRRAVAELAGACLLARHWPAAGRRHEASMAAAGLLIRGGLDGVQAEHLVYQAALAAGDDEAGDRRRDVRTTAAKVEAGDPVTGGPMLAELLRGDGARVVATLRKWLGLKAPPGVEPLTDVTNAARFVEQHGAVFRYCYAWGAGLYFDGGRWRRDAGDVAIRCAKETARRWFTDAARTPEETARKALAKWAIYANSEPGLRRMLTLAQAELAISPEQLDADPWLVNCSNGTLELRTGHLRPHRREDFLTKMTAAPYNPAARAALWERYLHEAIPDDGARDYAQRHAGYSLSGSTREEIVVFACGPVGSGKTTYTEALRRAWGDYAVSADFGSFLAKKATDGPREDLARLAGARLVTSVETRDGQRLAEGLIKLLTGGDTVTARRLYERTVEFVPQFKLLLASNYRPKASAEDDGLWRRLRELPFPTARIRREERDDSVKATLTDPAQSGSAILAWAVEGFNRWCTDGLGEPEAVMRATAAYRRSQEPLAEFIADCCTLDSALSVPATRLRDEYEAWCRSVGIRAPLAGRAWGAALRALGCTDRRSDVRWWDGISVRGAEQEPGDDTPGWVRE